MQRVRDEFLESLDVDAVRLLQREWMFGGFDLDEWSRAVVSHMRERLQIDRVRIERKG